VPAAERTVTCAIIALSPTLTRGIDRIMQWRNTAQGYGSVAKFLHWSIVVLIVVQYVLAEAAEGLPDGLEQLAVIGRHKSFGMLILGLAVVRIAWALANRGRPAPVALPRWQRMAAAASHGLLYLLILAQPLSGWLLSSAGSHPVEFFGLFQFPALVAPDAGAEEFFEEIHEAGFGALVTIATLHALAALYHHAWRKDDVLRRMVPFGRPRTF